MAPKSVARREMPPSLFRHRQAAQDHGRSQNEDDDEIATLQQVIVSDDSPRTRLKRACATIHAGYCVADIAARRQQYLIQSTACER